MKRLVCRKCGCSLFRFNKKSEFECYKCKRLIKITEFNNENIDNLNHISILWKEFSSK